MKVYISGPITGRPHGNVQAFKRAEELIRKAGYEPVNPQELEHNHGKTWAEFMRVDLAAMMDCQVIYLLDGWQWSGGSRIEALLGWLLGFEFVRESDRAFDWGME